MKQDYSRREFMKTASLAGVSLATSVYASSRPKELVTGETGTFPGKYKPTWDSLKQYRVPDWYLDAKFGIFLDRKSTRLNSSHLVISYAVFCLKKKKTN